MAADRDNMTFWDHLDELRGVLVRILLVVALFAVGFFFIMPWFFDRVILWPCSPDFPLYRLLDYIHGDGQFIPDLSAPANSITLINIKLGTQLMTHFSASFWMAVAFSFPVIIWLLWRFVSPGLYENEKRGSRKAFLFGNLMFYIGLAVGYFIVYPLALRFLSGYQLSDRIANTLTLDSYMDTFYSTIVALGVVFEMPVLAWVLGKAGVIDRGFFSRYRRHAIVGLCALAGIITPTSDLFTLAVVFVPLYALWEISSRLVPPAAPENTETIENTPG